MTGLMPTAVKRWLLTDSPQSDIQARCGRFYLNVVALAGNPLTVMGIVLVAALFAVALFAPLLATHGPNEQMLEQRLLPPGGEYLLGTDHLGRDIYSRLIYGARLSLYIILMVAAISTPLGVVIGITAGYFGGYIDTILMRITDIFMAFPRLILALAFVAVLGPGVENAVVAIAITTWPPYARISRAETLTLRSSDFIHAAKLQGAGGLHILGYHVMPLCITSVVVRMTLDMAGVIITAAGLGFLGLGAQPPASEWGAMIRCCAEFPCLWTGRRSVLSVNPVRANR